MKRTPLIGPHDLDRITEATRIAEKTTAGEIVTIITPRCDRYHFYPIAAGLIAAAAASIVSLFFSDALLETIRLLFWENSPSHALRGLFFIQSATFILFFLLSWIPAVKSRLIPRRQKQDRVRLRAESSFFRHNIASTRGGTGVLIFISLFERRVELLVDSAILKKIPDETWQESVDHIIQGIKTARFTPVLCEEIINCGELLAPHFPIQPDDINELADHPIIE